MSLGRAAPPPLAADVGIVAAMSVEVADLIGRLGRVRKYVGPRVTVVEGEHAGKLVAVVAGGMGRTLARDAAEVLLDGHRPRWLISPGFAGALDPALRRNDAILPREIVDPEGNTLAVDVRLRADDGPDAPRLRVGRLVTVDALARTTAEKEALRLRTGADIVDMETSAVARLCSERSVRFLAIRIVSDDAATELPPEVVTLGTKTGSRLVGSALRAIWNRPSCLKDLLALHQHAIEAADRLATVTLATIAALPD